MSGNGTKALLDGEAYLLPYDRLLRSLGLDAGRLPPDVHLSADQLMTLIRTLLKGVTIDEDWYCSHHPDVAAAIAAGAFRSAKQHFVENGYFEGRRCGPVRVDERWYLSHYPDVAESVDLGEVMSAQRHFDEHGEAEGRLPREW